MTVKVGGSLPDFVVGHEGWGVLPVGKYVVGTSDIIEHFVKGRPDEEHRASLVKDMLDYLQVLRGHGLHTERVLVDGSFVSDKLHPNDLDCSPIIDGSKSSPPAEILNNIQANWIVPKGFYKTSPVPGLGRSVRLDIYGLVLIPESHPNHQLGRDSERKRRDWWQTERGSNGQASKGYLEVIVDA